MVDDFLCVSVSLREIIFWDKKEGEFKIDKNRWKLIKNGYS